MAFGIPVIVPPVGGPSELVNNGQEGFLIDSRNSDQIAEKIIALADDKDICLQLSINCRRKFSNYSIDIFSGNILKLLEVVEN